MPEAWLYYVPCVLQHEGKIGFFAHVLETDHALNSPEAVWKLIDRLTEEHAESEPEGKILPVVPLGWTLITAQRGAAVKVGGNGRGPRKGPSAAPET